MKRKYNGRAANLRFDLFIDRHPSAEYTRENNVYRERIRDEDCKTIAEVFYDSDTEEIKVRPVKED